MTTIEILLIFLAGACVNMLVGALVWAVLDDKDQRLYRWYKDCPAQIAWFAQPLVLSLWPIGVWFALKNKST